MHDQKGLGRSLRANPFCYCSSRPGNDFPEITQLVHARLPAALILCHPHPTLPPPTLCSPHLTVYHVVIVFTLGHPAAQASRKSGECCHLVTACRFGQRTGITLPLSLHRTLTFNPNSQHSTHPANPKNINT